jgi:hypothetical protein
VPVIENLGDQIILITRTIVEDHLGIQRKRKKPKSKKMQVMIVPDMMIPSVAMKDDQGIILLLDIKSFVKLD